MHRLPHALSLLLLLLAPAMVNAAATPWAGDARGSARLITATQATGSATRLDAALQLRLAPGWHTYWRHAGRRRLPRHNRLDRLGKPRIRHGRLARAEAPHHRGA